MNDHNSSDRFNFDFYISASGEATAAQEVSHVLRQAGYSVYLPDRREDAAVNRAAANRSKSFVLLLLNDSKQQLFLREVLQFLTLADSERRVMIFKFEDCELAGLLDRNLITNLSGVSDAQERRSRILESITHPEGLQQVTTEFRIDQDKMPEPPNNPADNGHRLKTDEANPLIRTPEAPRRATVDLLAEQPRSAGSQNGTRIAERDPLVALVHILSEDDPGALARRGRTLPKWLPSELLAGRIAAPEVGYPAYVDGFDSLQAGENAIEFGISHPTEVALGTPFVVDALIYRQANRRLAILRAAELSTDGGRFRSVGANEVKRGIEVLVSTKVPWSSNLQTKKICWQEGIASCSFELVPPKYAMSRMAYGSCKISIDGLTVGQVSFQLHSGRGDKCTDRRVSRGTVIRSAFACYAHPDRRRALKRLQGVEELGVNVYKCDQIRASPRDNDRVRQSIDSADIMYLFWSRGAKRSNHIKQQWQYGIQKKGTAFIDLVPLVDPRRVSPPIELVDKKHFDDWARSYSTYERSIGALARFWSRLART
jgi:hypothetical protein